MSGEISFSRPHVFSEAPPVLVGRGATSTSEYIFSVDMCLRRIYTYSYIGEFLCRWIEERRAECIHYGERAGRPAGASRTSRARSTSRGRLSMPSKKAGTRET